MNPGYLLGIHQIAGYSPDEDPGPGEVVSQPGGNAETKILSSN